MYRDRPWPTEETPPLMATSTGPMSGSPPPPPPLDPPVRAVGACTRETTTSAVPTLQHLGMSLPTRMTTPTIRNQGKVKDWGFFLQELILLSYSRVLVSIECLFRFAEIHYGFF